MKILVEFVQSKKTKKNKEENLTFQIVDGINSKYSFFNFSGKKIAHCLHWKTWQNKHGLKYASIQVFPDPSFPEQYRKIAVSKKRVNLQILRSDMTGFPQRFILGVKMSLH